MRYGLLGAEQPLDRMTDRATIVGVPLGQQSGTLQRILGVG